MDKIVFEKVTALFQSIDEAIVVANKLDKAYADGTGHPEYHTKDFGLKDPQMIAMNLAGLYAADTAANLLCLTLYGQVTEKLYVEALEALVAGDIDDTEAQIVKNLANLAWRAGQPFRDIATNPLGRITREINMQFNLLPPDEEDKDMIQVVEGAKILLEWIKK
jgi:hypothetical protein